MSLDFNDAPRQQGFDLLPAGTLVKLFVTVRPGSVGPDGMLTQSKSSDAKYLDCEFTVASAPQRGRKIWQNFTLEGSEAQKAINISAGFIRGMLNSARNIKPDDDSEQARSGRVISGYNDLNGLEFAARVGIQKGSGNYPDRNTITNAIEPDHKDYQRVMSGETIGAGGAPGAQRSAGGAPTAAAPSWAANPAPGANQAEAPAQQQPSQQSNVPSWAT